MGCCQLRPKLLLRRAHAWSFPDGQLSTWQWRTNGAGSSARTRHSSCWMTPYSGSTSAKVSRTSYVAHVHASCCAMQHQQLRHNMACSCYNTRTRGDSDGRWPALLMSQSTMLMTWRLSWMRKSPQTSMWMQRMAAHTRCARCLVAVASVHWSSVHALCIMLCVVAQQCHMQPA